MNLECPLSIKNLKFRLFLIFIVVMVYFMPPPACGRRHPAARGIMYAGCPSVCPADCLSVWIIFFEWEGKTGRGDDPCQLKKFRQGGHMEGFNKYLS